MLNISLWKFSGAIAPVAPKIMHSLKWCINHFSCIFHFRLEKSCFILQDTVSLSWGTSTVFQINDRTTAPTNWSTVRQWSQLSRRLCIVKIAIIPLVRRPQSCHILFRIFSKMILNKSQITNILNTHALQKYKNFGWILEFSCCQIKYWFQNSAFYCISKVFLVSFHLPIMLY